MPGFELDSRAHLPLWPAHRDVGIGVVGAGFIVRDCHLVAYAQAGFPVVGITSRTHDRAREVADARGIPRVFPSLEAMLEEPAVEIVDIAVPPAEQPAVIRRVLAGGRKVRGILAQMPLALALSEARAGRRVRPGRCPAAGQPEHALRSLGAGAAALAREWGPG